MSRQPLCTVFVSFPNAPAVDTALTLLKGRNFNGLCKGPLKAEKATPRMSTFRQRTNEPLALADMSPVVRQNLEKEPTEGQHVMRHWLTVKRKRSTTKQGAVDHTAQKYYLLTLSLIQTKANHLGKHRGKEERDFEERTNEQTQPDVSPCAFKKVGGSLGQFGHFNGLNQIKWKPL